MRLDGPGLGAWPAQIDRSLPCLAYCLEICPRRIRDAKHRRAITAADALANAVHGAQYLFQRIARRCRIRATHYHSADEMRLALSEARLRIERDDDLSQRRDRAEGPEGPRGCGDRIPERRAPGRSPPLGEFATLASHKVIEINLNLCNFFECNRGEGTMKEYKVLTQKDKFFSNKFDPEKLEQALNAYAEQGWHVLSVTTASIPGFGGARDEVIVIFERENN